jgi:hypothetical protein
MLRKSLVPSVLLLTITAISTLTSATQAQEVQVPFKGSVVKACEFIGDKIQTGTLTGNDAIYPTQLSSRNKAGSAGSVTIKCNTNAVVSTRGYKSTNKEKEFEVSEAVYTVNIENQEPSDQVSVESGQTNIGVNLTLNSKSPIPSGDYSYNVVLSAVVGK